MNPDTNTDMSADFRRRVMAVLAGHYGLPAEALARPGTVLRPISPDAWDDWLELMPVGDQVGVEVPPHLRESLDALMAGLPAGHVLRGADFTAVWGAERARVGSMKVYMLDPACFRPCAPAPRYRVRALTAADGAAFDAFQARCSAADLGESDIGLDQDRPYGAFDGDRIVAGASTYRWLGMVDIGVLTDPDYRQQGLGKAVVAAVCAHILREGEIAVYRHGLSNRGSQGIAESLGFSLYAVAEAVHPVEG